MSRARNRHPGRLRIRLAELLREKGFEISEYDIDPAQGRVRNKSSYETDPVRWWGRGKFKGFRGMSDGLDVTLYGWSTITDCVRHGIVVDHPWNQIPCARDIWSRNESGGAPSN